MRKIICFFLIIFVSIPACYNYSYAASSKSVYILLNDNHTYQFAENFSKDYMVINKNGTYYVPAKAISSILHLNLEYHDKNYFKSQYINKLYESHDSNNKNGIVIYSGLEQKIIFFINSNDTIYSNLDIYMNNPESAKYQSSAFDGNVFTQNGDVYVPLKYLVEFFGYNVYEDNQNMYVSNFKPISKDDVNPNENYILTDLNMGMYKLTDTGVTARGIKLGDSYEKVIEKYGIQFMSGDSKNGTLWYNIPNPLDPLGSRGRITFDIKNGEVASVGLEYV